MCITISNIHNINTCIHNMHISWFVHEHIGGNNGMSSYLSCVVGKNNFCTEDYCISVFKTGIQSCDNIVLRLSSKSAIQETLNHI